jgi:hypothetical protein
MRTILKLAVVPAVVLVLLLSSGSQATTARQVSPGVGPNFSSIGALSFGPGGVLFAADNQAATIFAIDLGALGSGTTPGTKDVPALDQKIAAMTGTTPASVAITDLAVHPTSKNSFVSIRRGEGANAQSALLRIDGAGKIDLLSLTSTKFTSVTLPNPAAVSTDGRRGRTQSVTDLAFTNGRLFVAGLSNEEFASKLWSVAYPFTSVDRGASVEIYHGNHGQLETRSPVMTFVPYTVDNQPMIIAGYTCTPLVKFPVGSLRQGEKLLGTTMLELGSGNQPIDIVLYQKEGHDYLLMANTRHGVMKIPTAQFASAQAITSRVGGTQGSFERIAALQGVEQLDLLDAQRSIILARASDGSRNLSAVVLP